MGQTGNSWVPTVFILWKEGRNASTFAKIILSGKGLSIRRTESLAKYLARNEVAILNCNR